MDKGSLCAVTGIHKREIFQVCTINGVLHSIATYDVRDFANILCLCPNNAYSRRGALACHQALQVLQIFIYKDSPALKRALCIYKNRKKTSNNKVAVGSYNKVFPYSIL